MTYIQSKSNVGGGSTTDAFALTSNVTAHSVLVALVFWSSGTATCSVADNVNGSYTPLPGGPQVGTGGLAGFSFQAFYRLNATAGATTITATCSASLTSIGLCVLEEAGTATTSFDQSAYLATTGSSSCTCQAITPSQANAFLIAGFVVSNTGFAMSGYTLREEANWASNAAGDIQLTTAVSSSASLALAADTNQLTVNMSFVPTSAGPAFIAPRPLIVSNQAMKVRVPFQPRPHLAQRLLGAASTPPLKTTPLVVSQAKYASPYYRRPIKSHLAKNLLAPAAVAPIATRPYIVTNVAKNFRQPKLIAPHLPHSLIGSAVAQPIVTKAKVISHISKHFRQPILFKPHLAPAIAPVVTIPPLPPAIVISQAGWAGMTWIRTKHTVKTASPIVTVFGAPVDKTPFIISQAIKRPYVRLYPPHLAQALVTPPPLPPVKTTPTILSQALQRALIGRSKPALILPKPVVIPQAPPVASTPFLRLQAVQMGTLIRNRPFPAHLAKGVILAVAPPPGVDRVAKIISQALQRAVYTRSRPLHPLLAPPQVNPAPPPPPITFNPMGHRIRHQPYPGWPAVND